MRPGMRNKKRYAEHFFVNFFHKSPIYYIMKNKTDRNTFINDLKRMFPVTQISTFADTNDELIRVPQSRRVMFLNHYKKNKELYSRHAITVERRHGNIWIHIKCLEQETPVVKRPNFSEMLNKFKQKSGIAHI